MSTPSKNKGDRAERDLVKHLQANGFPNCRRGKAGGEADLGDVFGVVDCDLDAWTVQVADRKWRNHGELEAKAREAGAQSDRAGTPFWCLVTKRPRCTDVGDWFVWLPAQTLVECAHPPYGYGMAAPARVGGDLACITVRVWLLLVAPELEERAT
jgi:hypothetical protein